MSGHCGDCGNTLCICDGTPREEIAGTAEFNAKYIMIEMSAYKKLEQQNAKLKSALEFYATLKYVSDDMKEPPYKFGQRATEALKECEEMR